MFGLVLFTLLFDLALAAFGGHGNTISLQTFYQLSGGDRILFKERSFILAVGYIIGHLFGRIDG
jgi:hypothetical protein